MHQSCPGRLSWHIREDEQGRAKMGKWEELVRESEGLWELQCLLCLCGRAVFRAKFAPSRWTSFGDEQGYVMVADLREPSS